MATFARVEVEGYGYSFFLKSKIEYDFMMFLKIKQKQLYHTINNEMETVYNLVINKY